MICWLHCFLCHLQGNDDEAVVDQGKTNSTIHTNFEKEELESESVFPFPSQTSHILSLVSSGWFAFFLFVCPLFYHPLLTPIDEHTLTCAATQPHTPQTSPQPWKYCLLNTRPCTRTQTLLLWIRPLHSANTTHSLRRAVTQMHTPTHTHTHLPQTFRLPPQK